MHSTDAVEAAQERLLCAKACCLAGTALASPPRLGARTTVWKGVSHTPEQPPPTGAAVMILGVAEGPLDGGIGRRGIGAESCMRGGGELCPRHLARANQWWQRRAYERVE